MMERCAGWVDALLSRAVVERRFVSRHPAERAAALEATLRALPALREPDWFDVPPPLEPKHVTVGHRCGHPLELVTWDGPDVPAARKLGVELVTLGPQASLFARGSSSGHERRAVWILSHGWLGGKLAHARREWPFEALLAEYDLAHIVLPGHGPRRVPPNRGWPSFPTRNPFVNTLGLATATAELRQLVGWLRRNGYERVGIAGTSIGANVAALYASLSTDVERLILDRPLVRMSEPLSRVAVRQGGEYRALLTQLETVYAPVDLLTRPLTLPSDRIDIVLGRCDRIAGAAAAETLAARWGVLPQWFAGGHVLPIGRKSLLLAAFGRLPTAPPVHTSDSRARP